MSFTLFIQPLTHDLIMKGNRLVYTNGSDEVVQRVKIALMHEYGEYFLAKNSGVPYDRILGSKMQKEHIINIFRDVVMAVPGVMSIDSINFSGSGRQFFLTLSITTEDGNAANINNFAIGV